MSTVAVLVDFDNLEDSLKKTGPVNAAKILVSLVPRNVLSRHTGILVRLYGGWRLSGALSTAAQNLVPKIRADSPTVVTIAGGSATPPMRLTVELAEGPIGTSAQLQQTLVRDRDLRRFRARSTWAECARPGMACGMSVYSSISHSTPCSATGCGSRLSHVLVRDEQKMVDTLLVADIAYQALAAKATDIVVVSSDTDMWPGVMLATAAGCNITHIHTRQNWKTQNHLMSTLDARNRRHYSQLSV